MYQTPDPIAADLYVVTPIFNPIRYKSRWKHWQRFAKYVTDSGAKLVTVEASFGERSHACHLGDVIQVSGNDELWVKENLINIGISRLPANARYIAWIDADVIFADPSWVGRTIHALQHYDFVQMFSWGMDVGPTYEPVGVPVPGIIANPGPPEYKGGNRRSGLAWAARRDALDYVGGLMDFCVLGSADWHMAHALLGRGDDSRPEEVTDEYKRAILEWQYRALQLPRGVGYVPGLLLHYWHGRKVNRLYNERWKPLIEHQYNPQMDIKKNAHGVYQLCRHGERGNAIRDAFRAYFRARNEDSIDV